MTDSGSHGAGDDTETLTPLVVWGSAIRSAVHRDVHLEQADLCPLMAFFLGLDYPVNSVGQLRVEYFLPIDEDLLQAYLQNAHQLLEEVHQQHDQLKKRLLFFKPYPLNEETFFQRMQTMEGMMNVYQVKQSISGNDERRRRRFVFIRFPFEFRFHRGDSAGQPLLSHLPSFSAQPADQCRFSRFALHHFPTVSSGRENNVATSIRLDFQISLALHFHPFRRRTIALDASPLPVLGLSSHVDFHRFRLELARTRWIRSIEIVLVLDQGDSDRRFPSNLRSAVFPPMDDFHRRRLSSARCGSTLARVIGETEGTAVVICSSV